MTYGNDQGAPRYCVQKCPLTTRVNCGFAGSDNKDGNVVTSVYPNPGMAGFSRGDWHSLDYEKRRGYRGVKRQLYAR